LRQKLWLAGSMLTLFVLTLVMGNAFIPADKAVARHMLGHDFTAFYAAGHYADLGQFDKLYDIEAVKRFEQETGRRFGLSLGDSYGPYWNPPFYAWVFAPLARLPYPRALLTWELVNVAALAAAMMLLCRMLPEGRRTWRDWGLVPLLLATSMPVIQALSHGQNTCTSLLLLAVTVTFWRRGNGWLAGAVGGLLFYKPQLGAIVAVVMVLDLGVTALAGLTVTGIVLLVVTLLTMPGALGDFIYRLPANVRFMQVDHAYLWDRHATVKAFWRLLFQGRGAGEAAWIVTLLTVACTLALGSGVFYAVWRTPSPATEDVTPTDAPRRRRDRLVAATVATMPLLMPFYFDYDLMLLAVPAVLYAAERVGSGGAAKDVWLTRAWVALYAWMLVNPGIAAWTRVNLTVPLLACVSVMLIRRAMERTVSDVVEAPTYQINVQRRAA
jgi:hypothetical protein